MGESISMQSFDADLFEIKCIKRAFILIISIVYL